MLVKKSELIEHLNHIDNKPSVCSQEKCLLKNLFYKITKESSIKDEFIIIYKTGLPADIIDRCGICKIRFIIAALGLGISK